MAHRHHRTVTQAGGPVQDQLGLVTADVVRPRQIRLHARQSGEIPEVPEWLRLGVETDLRSAMRIDKLRQDRDLSGRQSTRLPPKRQQSKCVYQARSLRAPPLPRRHLVIRRYRDPKVS